VGGDLFKTSTTVISVPEKLKRNIFAALLYSHMHSRLFKELWGILIPKSYWI